MICLVGDRLMDAEEARVSILDRGYQYGDGLFETLRVRKGRIEFAAAHARRLLDSASELGIVPVWDSASLIAAMAEVVRANGGGNLVLRVQVTRGFGGRRLDLDGTERSVRVIVATPFAAPDRERMMTGLRLATAPFPRSERSPLARYKTTNYLESILARAAARRAGADEALLLNTAGRPAEAAAANLFLVLGRRLVTPAIEEGALPGIVRAATIRAAAEIGVPVEERPIDLAELFRTPEVFLTNSLLPIASVVSIDGRALPEPSPDPIVPVLRIRVRSLALEDGAG